jgi:hypothetical protein
VLPFTVGWGGVQHYLDKLVHGCTLRPAREYSARAGGSVAAASRQQWAAAAGAVKAVHGDWPQGHAVQFAAPE